MFLSKCLVSKKGPLGAIWVAAYFFKKLKKAQIFEINIPSSVDNILQDQLGIHAYRVLAYLLLGVVRIYSKKVEYLFDDCQEVLIKINEFVVREKNRAKKEALRATCFSITRPISFDLDAFDLEIHEDTSGDNVVTPEEITLKDAAWKNAGIRQYSLDRLGALDDDDFFMDYNPTEDLSCYMMDFETEARTLHDVSHLEASMKRIQSDKSFHVEVPDMASLENHMNRGSNREKYNDRFSSEECLNRHSEDEEDPLRCLEPHTGDQSSREIVMGSDLSEPKNKVQHAMEVDHVSILEASSKVLDDAGFEHHTEREAIRENCNDRFASEEGVNLPCEAEEELLRPAKSLGENQANREKMRDADLPQSENEVHHVMEEDHIGREPSYCRLEASVEGPNIAGSENHIGREVRMEIYNDEFYKEEYFNLSAEVEDKSPGLIKHSGEEQTTREKIKDSDRVQSENEVHHVMEKDFNLEATVEKLQVEGFSPMDLEEPSPLVRTLDKEIQTSAEQVHFPAMTPSKDQNCQVAGKDHPLSVTVDKTPQSMLQDASATTPSFMLIPTPVTKERARKLRKRKCFFDDVIVFPNGIIRQWINDASDLVSKRRKGGCAAHSARETHLISSLPQSFSELSIPCTSELKSLFCGKRLKLLEPVKIMEPPEKMDTSEPPAVGGSAEIAPGTVEIRDPPHKLSISPPFDESSEQPGIAPQTPIRSPSLLVRAEAEIAPQTPVLHSKSMRPFESPENLKCNYFDEERPENVDPNQITEKEPSRNEIVEEELLVNKDLDINLLNEEIHSNEDDNQGQDGWSMRTRTVSKNLQRIFLDQRKRGEEEQVKLSQLLEGSTKKASARLFYEILVLKTKGLVDVKQDTAFADIIVLEVPP